MVLEFEDLLTKIGNEIDEIKEALKNPGVEEEKKKVLRDLIDSYGQYKTRKYVDSLAKVVFCGWTLTSCTESEREKLCSYRKNELRSLVINGFDEVYLPLANRLRDELFLYDGDDGEEDNVGLDVLMTRFSSNVDHIIVNKDISQQIGGVTCKNLLDLVMAKCTKKPVTPLLELHTDLIGMKTGPKHRRFKGLQNNNTGMVTLKDWLTSCATGIIEFITIKSGLIGLKKEKGELVPAPDEQDPYLSNGFKKIMSSVTYELKLLHDEGFIHGKLSEDTILIRLSDLAVRLTYNFERGDPETDCKCLKKIIENAVDGKAIPADLSHFLGEETKSNLMYYHPAFWSPYDMIYMVDQLAAACYTDDTFKVWIANLPNDVGPAFEKSKDKYTFLEDFYTERKSIYGRYKVKPRVLLVMRDALYHIDKYVKEQEDTSVQSVVRVTRMTELYCPDYLAKLMKIMVVMIDCRRFEDWPVVKRTLYSRFDLLPR